MQNPIYLDNHATTPLDPRVCDAMLPFLREEYGNASSNTHTFGWKAKAAVEKARASVADLIGAYPDEIVFTSGATESNNWALIGTLKQGDHAITTSFEHRAILSCLEHLKSCGVGVTLLKPDANGQVAASDFEKAILSTSKLISCMLVNNEVGAILPVAAIGEIAKEKDLLFHCDAAQAAGKITIDVNRLNLDFLSLSAHKMYGPKGVGALYVRRNRKSQITPMFWGGGHEGGLRAGTLNVPGIVGFGVACELALSEMATECQRVTRLRDRLWKKLKESIPTVLLNGSMQDRVTGNLNFSFEGVDGEGLLLHVQSEIALSASSACASSGRMNSHVLSSMGLSPERMQASFRIGVGRFNTEQEIDRAAEILCLAHAKAQC